MARSAQTILLNSIERLMRRDATRNLQKMLARVHAADVAGALDHIEDVRRMKLFRLIPRPQQRAEALVEASDETQRDILQQLDDLEVVDVLEHLFGDDAADIIDQLPEERQSHILATWSGASSSGVDELLGYGPETAGGIMSPEVFALHEDTLVSEAIATLQASHEQLELAFYLYVVTDLGQLAGVCSLRQLVVSDPTALLKDICAVDIVSVGLQTDQEVVARYVAKYNLLAVPVVDDNNVLVGIVTVDDVIDVIREEATEDMFKMAGAGADTLSNGGVLANVKARMPWLLACFLGGIGSMFVIGRFEAELSSVTALAAFIPIVLGMGGNVGTQAATIMVRSISLGHVESRNFKRILGREILVGAIGGFFYGALLAAIATGAYNDAANAESWSIVQLGLTVSISIAVSMTVAATVGSAVPVLFARIGVDPAVATGPIVTTGVDLSGIFTYFLIATWMFGL